MSSFTAGGPLVDVVRVTVDIAFPWHKDAPVERVQVADDPLTVKRRRPSPATEFRAGWRGYKRCHSRDWLVAHHHENGETLAEMALAAEVTEAAIRYWMKKLAVEVRVKGEVQSDA